MKDAEDKFISFLEEKGVLEEFKTNLKNTKGFDDLKAWLKMINLRDFFFFAFPWGYKSEWKKWSALNEEWKDFIKQDCAE